MINPSITEKVEDHVSMVVTCTSCSAPQALSVDAEQWAAWQGGALIHVAMPDLSPESRELLISGICPECWSKIFPMEDED
jgi:hypothetical protein